MGGKNSKDKTSLPSSSSLSFFRFKSKSKQIHKSNKNKLKTAKSATHIHVEQYATPYSNSLPRVKEPPKSSPQHDKVIEYKLYRSYSDIRQETTCEEVVPPAKSVVYQPETSANIRVYRKSSGADRFETLLRDNSKKRRDTCATAQMPRKTEAMIDSQFNTITAGQMRHTFQDNSHFSRGRASSNTSIIRASTLKRTVSRISTSSIGYNVSANDMPSVSTVKKKTRQFELSFVRRLSDLIDSLPLEMLVKQVVVGLVQLPNGALGCAEKHDCFFINIERFLLKKDQLEELMVPLINSEMVEKLKDTLTYSKERNYNVADQNASNEEKSLENEENAINYDKNIIKNKSDIKNNLIENKGLYSDHTHKNVKMTSDDIKATKTTKNMNNSINYTVNTRKSIINNKQLSDVLKQIINSYLISVSKELSRIYEYQLALISDGLNLDLLSRFAAECVINFLEFPDTSLPIFHVDSAVHSVVWGKPTNSKLGNSTLSILIGEKELKWKIEEIFRKPALRLDCLLYEGKIEVTRPEHSPWRFFSQDGCDFLLYGYRGPVIDKSPRPHAYRLHRNELCFDTEIDWMEEDFHRCYTPYRKLVGRKVMELYNKMTKTKTGKVKRSFTFSTPKHDLSIQSNEFDISENNEENAQILSFTSFVPLLLGDEVGKEEMEVIHRYVENEKALYAHFNNLREENIGDFCINKNNNSNKCGEFSKDSHDSSANTHDTNSFNLKDLEYTCEDSSNRCSIERRQNATQCEISKIGKTSINEKEITNESQPKLSISTTSDILDSNNNIAEITSNHSLNNRDSHRLNVKDVIKYSLTPIKSQRLVDPNCYIPAKRLDSLELEDLYIQSDSITGSNEDLTEATTTTSACFNLAGVADELRTSNEELSACLSTSIHENLNQSFEDKTHSSLHTSPRVSERSAGGSKKSPNTTKSSLASDV